jgi:hypothetical protein
MNEPVTVELTLTEARCLVGAAGYYRYEIDATGKSLAAAIRKVRQATDEAVANVPPKRPLTHLEVK